MADQPKPATITDVVAAVGDLWHEARAHAKAAQLLGHGLAVGDITEQEYADAIAKARELAHDTIAPLIDTVTATLSAYRRVTPIAEAKPVRSMRIVDTVGGGLIR